MSDASGTGFSLSSLLSSLPQSGSLSSSQLVALESLPKDLAILKQVLQLEALVHRVQTVQAEAVSQLINQQQQSTGNSKPVYQVVLSTQYGDVSIQTTQKFETGQKFYLELQPGTPPKLSQIILADVDITTAQQSTATQTQPPITALTPVLPPSFAPLPGVTPLQVGGVIEAFLLPVLSSSNPQSPTGTQSSLQGTPLQGKGVLSPAISNSSQTLPQTGQVPMTGKSFSSSIPQPVGQPIVDNHSFVLGTKGASLLSGALLSSQQDASHPLKGYQRAVIKIAHFGPPPSGFVSKTTTASQTVNVAGQQFQLSQSKNILSPLLQGTVVGKVAGGSPIVMTDDIGHILVLTNTNLPEGAKIAFQVMYPNNLSSVSKGGTMRVPSIETGGYWSAFDQLSLALGSEPVLLTQFQQQIPKPNKGLPNLLTFFLTALRLGGENAGSAWLGQSITQFLRNNEKQMLLDRLSGDLKALSKDVKERKTGLEFRSTHIPMMYEDQIQPIQLFTRQYQGGKEDSDDGSQDIKPLKQVRFIVNLLLSRLGNVQLDGVIKQKNIDIVLRLEKQIPKSIESTMQQRYQDVLGSLGMQGSLVLLDIKDWVEFDPINTDDIQMNV